MKRNEKGFMIIEMLIALVLISAVVGATVMTTTASITNYQQSTDQNIVLQQVQNAGYWISRDVQMASEVNPDAYDGFPLILYIPVDTYETNDLRVYYLFQGSKLKREVYDSTNNLVSRNLIADYIDMTNTSFISLGCQVYQLDIRASKGETSVEASYEVSQRLGAL